MTTGKRLCLSLFCCQPNQISIANKTYFHLAGFKLENVCAAQVKEKRRKQFFLLYSSQVSGEGWHQLVGKPDLNSDWDPQSHGWAGWAHCWALFHPPLLSFAVQRAAAAGPCPAGLVQRSWNLGLALAERGVCVTDPTFLSVPGLDQSCLGTLQAYTLA